MKIVRVGFSLFFISHVEVESNERISHSYSIIQLVIQDTRALVREEIRILAKRVDALIEWTEKFGKMMLIFRFLSNGFKQFILFPPTKMKLVSLSS